MTSIKNEARGLYRKIKTMEPEAEEKQRKKKVRKWVRKKETKDTERPLPLKKDMRQLCAGYKNLARRARRAGQVFVSKEIKTGCNDFSQTGEGQHRVQDDRNKLHYINFGYAPTYAPYIYIYIRKNEIFLWVCADLCACMKTIFLTTCDGNAFYFL